MLFFGCCLTNSIAFAQGSLMIIGGGYRPPELVDRMISESGIKAGGYVLILPMASTEQDSAIWYAQQQFNSRGLMAVVGMQVKSGEPVSKQRLDSIRAARLIYLTGGDQLQLMNTINGTGIGDAIETAYTRGAMIAGTSAGAAAMSKIMITGNEKKTNQYSETFQCIEADNIELSTGLGLISGAIIDQHFIKRSRYNRLLTVVLENPGVIGIGIDEATAILVKDKKAEVIGISQVIVFKNKQQKPTRAADKLGARNIEVSIYLPGENFVITAK